MKVGILTFPNSTSYGATLQMYALCHTVDKLGHNAESINYYSEYMKSGKHVTKTAGKRSLHDIVRYGAKAILHPRFEKKFHDFERKNVALYPRHYIVDKTLLSLADERYDAVICGSDQVWNPDITGKDISYFLDFCGENTRRISYAPSFGIENLPDDFYTLAQEQIKKFDFLSVREESGLELIKQMTGKECPIVTDPTFLLSSDEWEKIEKSHPLGKGDYILCYAVRSSQSLVKYCKALAEKTGLKIIVIGGNFIKRFKNRDKMIDYAVDVSPEEWLYLVHHAKYVVTNSFHGTAFSINYRKAFYLELSSKANSRLEYIVSSIGLENRIVESNADIEPSTIDYTDAERKLKAIVGSSLDYLKTALEVESDNG